MSWSVSVPAGPAVSFEERADEAQQQAPSASYFTGDTEDATREQYDVAVGAATSALESLGWENVGTCTLNGHVQHGEGSAPDSLSIYLNKA